MTLILDQAHLLKGFNKTTKQLIDTIKQSLSDAYVVSDASSHKANKALKPLATALLDSVDFWYTNQQVAPPASYYNLALLVWDKVKDKALDMCYSEDEYDVEMLQLHIDQVAYDVIQDYLTRFYEFCDTPLNKEVVERLQSDIEQKMKPLVNGGLLNAGDYKVVIYVNDDEDGDDYCKSYGFIDFKQNVTPFQIGVAKFMLEEQYWELNEYPIELKINSLKK
jgi:hypothetical protein